MSIELGNPIKTERGLQNAYLTALSKFLFVYNWPLSVLGREHSEVYEKDMYEAIKYHLEILPSLPPVEAKDVANNLSLLMIAQKTRWIEDKMKLKEYEEKKGLLIEEIEKARSLVETQLEQEGFYNAYGIKPPKPKTSRESPPS